MQRERFGITNIVIKLLIVGFLPIAIEIGRQ
jgi:hypothetical protein